MRRFSKELSLLFTQMHTYIYIHEDGSGWVIPSVQCTSRCFKICILKAIYEMGTHVRNPWVPTNGLWVLGPWGAKDGLPNPMGGLIIQ